MKFEVFMGVKIEEMKKNLPINWHFYQFSENYNPAEHST